MIKVKYTCRRRGYLGSRILPDHYSRDPLFMAPVRGVYKSVETIENTYECEYDVIKPQVIYQSPEASQVYSQSDYSGERIIWIEDREEERRQARHELKVKDITGDFCEDGC